MSNTGTPLPPPPATATGTNTPAMPAVNATGSTPLAPTLQPAISTLESDLRAELSAHVTQVKSILTTLVAELAAGASNAVPKTQATLNEWISEL